MESVILLLGTNEGDRQAQLSIARAGIVEAIGHILQASQIYETAAWGKTDQPAHLNQVLKVATVLKPMEVLAQIHVLEARQGRQRLEKWGSRPIDIDILFYNDVVVSTEVLTIPHPWIQDRRFTLVPLAEIVPTLIHPVFHKSVQVLLDECQDTLDVRLYK